MILKKSYISEDEGAGYAAPIIDLISSSQYSFYHSGLFMNH